MSQLQYDKVDSSKEIADTVETVLDVSHLSGWDCTRDTGNTIVFEYAERPKLPPLKLEITNDSIVNLLMGSVTIAQKEMSDGESATAWVQTNFSLSEF